MTKRHKDININSGSIEPAIFDRMQNMNLLILILMKMLEDINVKDRNIHSDYKVKHKAKHKNQEHSFPKNILPNIDSELDNEELFPGVYIKRYAREKQPSMLSRFPVVLAQTEVEVFLEAVTEFPEEVYQIKSSDKKVFLKDFRLINEINKLFIKGFIEETVEYVTAGYISENAITGTVKKVVFNIPFECSTEVSFAYEPRIYRSFDVSSSGILGMGSNNVTDINRKILVEIDNTKIFETSIKEDIKELENTFSGACTFKKIRKKLAVSLTLNLLQDQVVYNPHSILDF